MNYIQLIEQERYQIYALKKAKHSQEDIATLLNRSPSTISREIRRNKGLRGHHPKQAQAFCSSRRQEAHKTIKVTDEVWAG